MGYISQPFALRIGSKVTNSTPGFKYTVGPGADLNQSPNVNIVDPAAVADVAFNWTSVNSLVGIGGNDVTVSPDTGRGVAVEVGGTISYSDDGFYWVFSAGALPANPGRVFWCNTPSLFIATGVNSASWSADAVNFTAIALAGISGGAGIVGAWSEDLQVAVLLGTTPGANDLATSPDGKAFTVRQTGFGPVTKWASIAWVSAIGKFVALGETSPANHCVIGLSSNGINWTQSALPAAFTANMNMAGIDYSPQLGLILIAGTDHGGPSSAMATSPDAVTWTVQANPALLPIFQESVTWSPECQCFLIPGMKGSGLYQQHLMYSFNAVNWTVINSNVLPMGTARINWAEAWGAFLGIGGGGGFLCELSRTIVPSRIFTDIVVGRETLGGIVLTGNGTILTATGELYGTNGYKGTPTNNNAPAGAIGELFTSTIAVGAAVALTTGVAANITSIPLTPGDWDIDGQIDLHPAATTTLRYIQGGSSAVSATLGAQDTYYSNDYQGLTVVNDVAFEIPRTRISIAANTTVYLVILANFTTSTLSAYGTIRARRVR